MYDDMHVLKQIAQNKHVQIQWLPIEYASYAEPDTETSSDDK